MNNFELNKQADDLVQTTSHYQLAREYLQLEEKFNKLWNEYKVTDEQSEGLTLEDFHEQVEELVNKIGERGIRIDYIRPQMEATIDGIYLLHNMEVEYFK